MDTMKQRLKHPNSALVIFTNSFKRTELPPKEEITSGLSLFVETNDGAIYIDTDDD
jgi:uncharacterized protein YchJ